jgi:hypothetical protein
MQSFNIVFVIWGVLAASLLGVLAHMQAGWRRRVLAALLIAIVVTPTIVGGHGVGIIPAIFLVFGSAEKDVVASPGAMLMGLYPIAFVFLIVFLALSVHRLLKKATIEPALTWEKVTFVAVVVVVAGALLIESARREHWAKTKDTIGPYVVRIDTPQDSLKDIVVGFGCESRFDRFGATRIVESGQAIEFSEHYFPYWKRDLRCRVSVAHPELEFLSEEASLKAPRAQAELQFNYRTDVWDPESIPRVRDGVDVSAEQELRYEVGARDALDWRLQQLEMTWLPPFCASDLERIKREYVPQLALLRTRLLISGSLSAPAQEEIDIINTRFGYACDYHLRQQVPAQVH